MVSKQDKLEISEYRVELGSTMVNKQDKLEIRAHRLELGNKMVQPRSKYIQTSKISPFSSI